jgi:protease-4
VGLGGDSRIAFITGQGSILRGGAPAGLGEETASIYSAPFVRMLRDVAADESISGVILRVDSPGGDAIASDDILYEVKKLSEEKPLVISMSDVAASGGYYIAMSGDPVLAYPNTITGSIGVIYGKVNLQGLYKKLGLDVTIMSRGRFADIDTSARPLTPEGREKLRAGIDHVYQSFLARVAEGRNAEVDEIAQMAEGRVWMGAQAVSNGLVDELGGLDRAIELVKERAEIPAGENVQLVLYPAKRSFFDQLFSRASETTVEDRLHRELARLAPGWDLRLFQPGGILRLMPFRVQTW